MTIAALITSLRILAQDGPTDHVVFGESLGSAVGQTINGTNTVFRLGGADGHSLPYVTGSIFITKVGVSFRSQTGFTETSATYGIITFSVAPAVNVNVLADYNYYWFTDTKYTEFLAQAAQTTLAGTTDATTVPEGLKEAMMQYALSLFFTSRASQYAERYASSGGEAGESVDSVSKAYIAMSAAARKRGDDFKVDYYKRQGQREAPAVSMPAFGIDPITPMR